ncbi:MAG: lipoate--protein ligase family protein [Candidatus Omnitrophica bacterium]|jgi:lipoate-protein ligase A|nr:lipoate--protein ligase family protein [Candidatus Omnitrophota bacterium]
MKKKWRLILDDKHDGYYNMAIDEAILINYRKENLPTLRIYGWKFPFLSLGYNQNPRDILNFDAKIPFVRRITGGAAILHSQELTYSLTCALSDINLSCGVKESFKRLASFLVKFYRYLGLKAQFAQDFLEETFPLEKKNLGRYKNYCFSSREHYDLLIGGKKIGGNAQKRIRDIIFQQGTIPQNIDFDLTAAAVRGAFKLQDKITFLDKILESKTNFRKLQSLLSKCFQEEFNLEVVKEPLSNQEKNIAEVLTEYKYRNELWNMDRQLDISKLNNFS